MLWIESDDKISNESQIKFIFLFIVPVVILLLSIHIHNNVQFRSHSYIVLTFHTIHTQPFYFFYDLTALSLPHIEEQKNMLFVETKYCLL